MSTAAIHLRLFEDVIADDASYPVLPSAPRFLYVASGAAIRDGDRVVEADDGWYEEGPPSCRGGIAGATIWRWELSGGAAEFVTDGPGWRSYEKLSARLTPVPVGPLLMRGDSVAFPAGGCALRHVHQGPGIRCLIAGGIRIDTHGRSTSYAAGGAWYEAGPEPVFAQATDRPTRFIRCMVLPAALLGKSSIRYVDPADRDRPKDQQYRSYIDVPIAF